MPADLEAQVLAARTGAALFDLTPRGILALTGEDRVRFLNGMITQDVKALAGGAGKYALLCNAKGKILADLYVWAAGDRLLVECEPALLPKIRSTLEHYIIADDVELADVSDAFAVFHLAGPKAGGVLRQAGLRVPERAFLREECALEGAGLTVARTDRAGSPESLPKSLLGYDLWCEPSRKAALEAALQRAGAAKAAAEALHVLQLEAGIPRYGTDFGEENLPQEANLKNAFSTTKGCYTGQEVICKIESFAHVNKHLFGFEIKGEAPPPAGAALLAGETEIGALTQSARSPTLGSLIALGYVRHKATEDGTDLSALDVRWEGGAARARKVNLPFVKGAGPG